MVCIYCSSPTSVKNSRLQRQNNSIWRRRSCAKCTSIFTTVERTDLSSTFVVRDASNKEVVPLSRDKLFLSIYKSCKHRPGAMTEASSLAQTVINNLVAAHHRDGVIDRHDVSRQTHSVLKRFDDVAATFYAAYHDVAL